ncbi:MAG: non-homologous end-joining DNA ligase [Gemmatimonadetes bacterium]|nr:non-homologous end-joining DNA ligase [Gemmatimonadota bacterium]
MGRAHGDAEPAEVVAGVRLTSPGRVLYAEQGVTKLDLARYYESVSDRMLPLLSRRPLSLVRCPQGRRTACFYQKHADETFPKAVRRIRIAEKAGPVKEYAYVTSLAGVVALVNLGTLELHTWGVHVDRLERPDRLVFDLDPGPGVAWDAVCEAALHLRDRLEELGLRCFAKTTGGKGLHVVVPLLRRAAWRQTAGFARAFAKAIEAEDPDRFTTEVAKARRHDRILIDYLRNTRGATAVEAYSTRARPHAPVATPVRWDEVGPGLRPDGYTVSNFGERLRALGGEDPWAGYREARQALPATALRALGVS